MKKEKAKELNRLMQHLADKLPDRWEVGVTYVSISGKELLLSGYTNGLINGKAIVKEQDYQMPIPVRTKVNHLARLWNAYRNFGAKGMYEYLKPFIRSGAEETFRKNLFNQLKPWIQNA